MIEIILSTLAEFGLIREDYKHRKRVNRKEKEDRVKRPIQKYFLQPSALILMAVLVIGSLSAILFFTYQRISVFPRKTVSEISEMSARMEEWNEKFGRFPSNLEELIGNSPITQDWKKDVWNREYNFTITENGNDFSIISAGADGKFGTEDDLKSE